MWYVRSFFCEGAAQRISKQSGVGHYLRIWGNNSEYEDYECTIKIYNSDHFNHRSDSVYDKSSYDEMLKMLFQEKKNLRGKGRRVNNNNK